MLRRREPEDLVWAASMTETRWSLPSSVQVSVPSPYHLSLIFCDGTPRFKAGSATGPSPAGSGPAPAPVPGGQIRLAHQRSHGISLTREPASVKVGGDPQGELPFRCAPQKQ